jgi:hypothetical protein
MPYTIIVLILILILIPLVWAFMDALDGSRINNYIRSQGGTLLDKRWTPFGPGWFGEKDSRIYRIHYLDREGNTHEAACKTGMLSGVYLTGDVITDRVVPETRDTGDLEEENRRLREEIERLRRM